ncbi:MAG TPA: HEAT repeat domain-containing protein [Vicinamibacteria bacterium]|nr:HEAT repeat domain-containing protein [Vicinamibacteria bacterium]
MRRTSLRGTRPLAPLVLLAIALPAPAAPRRPPAPPPRSERLARLLRLEDTRSTGSGELLALLGDADRGVRRRAALAAGRIGDRAMVGPLLPLVADPETEVRRMAAFALGLLGDTAAVDRLLAALKDPEALVRARAAEALGRLGDARAAPSIALALLDSLPKTSGVVSVRGDDPASPADSWAEPRSELFALARLKDLPSAQRALVVEGRSRFDWWAATWTAMRLESPQLRPVLLSATSSDDPRSRALAARGLGALKDTSSAELLLRLVRDGDETVAVQALRALSALGESRATSAAAALLASPSDLLRREALRALATLPPDPALRPRLVALVAERSSWVRGAAFGALAHTSPEDFALVLSGLDQDPDFRVRQELASALGATGGDMAIGVLHGMLKDEDARVLPAVLEALVRARGQDALDTLRRHLEHPDLGVRAAAADEIARLGAHGLSEPLVAAWRRGLGDGAGELEARISAVAALLAQKDEPARAGLLRVAAEDPSRAVRARAAQAARELGASPPEVGPERVWRPALDYREAMAPYQPSPAALYTPRAFLHTRKGTIELHLDVVEAPLTTASFLALAQAGFYDGLTFHRVEPGFVVQGGDPRGDGNGGPGYTLRCELSGRGYARGSVGMALSGRDTGGSQFFITLQPQPQLEGGYTLFGRVAAGMEVADRLRPGDAIERVEVWTGE